MDQITEDIVEEDVVLDDIGNDEGQDNIREDVQDDDTSRFHELNGKADRTPEEDDELVTLKANYGKKTQKRMAQITYKYKSQLSLKDQELARKDQELQELRASIKPQATPVDPIVNNQTVTVGDKQFYTDDALISMRDAGKISDQDAINHQQQRIKKEAALEAYEMIRQENDRTRKVQANQDIESRILSTYPEFDQQHPNHDPNHPVYSELRELVQGGMSLEKAFNYIQKRNPKRQVNSQHPDLSSDLSVNKNGLSSNNNASKMVGLTEVERDMAKRMFVFSGRINPKTNKPYTDKEAIEKATLAKNRGR